MDTGIAPATRLPGGVSPGPRPRLAPDNPVYRVLDADVARSRTVNIENSVRWPCRGSGDRQGTSVIRAGGITPRIGGRRTTPTGARAPAPGRRPPPNRSNEQQRRGVLAAVLAEMAAQARIPSPQAVERDQVGQPRMCHAHGTIRSKRGFQGHAIRPPACVTPSVFMSLNHAPALASRQIR